MVDIDNLLTHDFVNHKNTAQT